VNQFVETTEVTSSAGVAVRLGRGSGPRPSSGTTSPCGHRLLAQVAQLAHRPRWMAGIALTLGSWPLPAVALLLAR
jgi:hypothetical protein